MGHQKPFSQLTIAAIGLVSLFGCVADGDETSSSPHFAMPSQYWTNSSPHPAINRAFSPAGYSPEGVDARTGEVRANLSLVVMPGLRAPVDISLTYDSMLVGTTQVGKGMLLSVEWSLQLVGSTQVDVRTQTGEIWTFNLSGSTWVPASSRVTSTLTSNPATGEWTLADKIGGARVFNSLGHLTASFDKNNNTRSYNYNASAQLTSMTDERNQNYSFGHDANGMMTSITDPASRTHTLVYDGQNQLTSVITPGSADQPLGITTTLSYDAQGRLSTVTDGRGTVSKQFSYVGATGQVANVTEYGSTAAYTWSANRLDRTDANGNTTQTHFSGSDIVQSNLLVGGQAQMTTQYRSSSLKLDTIVAPNGNRLDFSYDAANNVTQTRLRKTDTAINDDSDLVASTTYQNNQVASYTNPGGSVTTFLRDAFDNPIEVQYPDVTEPTAQEASTTASFNASGQLLSLTNEELLTATRTYYDANAGSSQGLLKTLAVGTNTWTFTYDAAGNTITMTDSANNTTSTAYDALNRVTSTSSAAPFNYGKKFTYDANGNVIKIDIENKDENNLPDLDTPWIGTTFGYTGANQVASVTDSPTAGTSRSAFFTYDNNQNLIQAVDPLGTIYKNTYGTADRLTSTTKAFGTAEQSTIGYGYDAITGKLITVTDPKGTTQAIIGYDDFGRQESVTDAHGTKSAVSYNKNGAVTSATMTDSAGQVLQAATMQLDERGRQFQIIARNETPGAPPTQAVETIQFLKDGRRESMSDAAMQSIQLTYDSLGYLESEVGASGVIKTIDQRDLHGRPLKVTSTAPGGLPMQSEIAYDELGRVVAQTTVDTIEPANSLVTEYHYDSRNNVVLTIDAGNRPSKVDYDLANRKTAVHVALSAGMSMMAVGTEGFQFLSIPPPQAFPEAITSSVEYDDANHVVARYDDDMNETSYSYDALGRPLSMTRPDQSQASATYDDNGNIATAQDFAGNSVVNSYDRRNRLVARSVSPGPGFDTESQSFSYDALDRVISTSNGLAQIDYAWATRGFASQLHSTTQQIPGSEFAPQSWTGQYDVLGRPTSEQYPTGLQLDTLRDPTTGRMIALDDNAGQVASFDVQAGAHTTTLQSGTVSTAVLGSVAGQTAEVSHQSSNYDLIASREYSYSTLTGQLSSVRVESDGEPASHDVFGYDLAGRLVSAYYGALDPQQPEAGYVAMEELSLTDDGPRNLRTRTAWGQTPVDTTYTSDLNHRYDTVNGQPLLKDQNGNVLDDGVFFYQFNSANQVVQVNRMSDGSVVATYGYGPDGRRVVKATYGPVPDQERYVYGQDGRLIAVYGSGDMLRRSFIYGKGLLAVEQADTVDYDNDGDTIEWTRFFYHRDASDSVIAITAPDESVVAEYRYDSNGVRTILQGGVPVIADPLGQPFFYGSAFFDEETGHYASSGHLWDPDWDVLIGDPGPGGGAGGDKPKERPCPPFYKICSYGKWPGNPDYEFLGVTTAHTGPPVGTGHNEGWNEGDNGILIFKTCGDCPLPPNGLGLCERERGGDRHDEWGLPQLSDAALDKLAEEAIDLEEDDSKIVLYELTENQIAAMAHAEDHPDYIGMLVSTSIDTFVTAVGEMATGLIDLGAATSPLNMMGFNYSTAIFGEGGSTGALHNVMDSLAISDMTPSQRRTTATWTGIGTAVVTGGAPLIRNGVRRMAGSLAAHSDDAAGAANSVTSAADRVVMSADTPGAHFAITPEGSFTGFMHGSDLRQFGAADRFMDAAKAAGYNKHVHKSLDVAACGPRAQAFARKLSRRPDVGDAAAYVSSRNGRIYTNSDIPEVVTHGAQSGFFNSPAPRRSFTNGRATGE